jgi:hypothetical protein
MLTTGWIRQYTSGRDLDITSEWTDSSALCDRNNDDGSLASGNCRVPRDGYFLAGKDRVVGKLRVEN